MRIGSDIAERLLRLATGILDMATRLPRSVGGRHVAGQIVRSASGGGANYEEARAAESRDDFIHKLGIAAKEVRETIFWLRLIHRSGWTAAGIPPLTREAQALAAILGASIRTARAKAPETHHP